MNKIQGIKRISSDSRSMDQWYRFLKLKNGTTVLDLTCGGALETIYVAKDKRIKSVIGYELDPERFQVCQKNVEATDESIRSKITLVNGDSTQTFGKEFDLILFDPPWTFTKDEEYMQGKRDEFEVFQKEILNDYRKTKKLPSAHELASSNAKIPLTSVNLQIGKYDVQTVIDKSNFGTLVLKIPLNCIQSPYSANFQPLKQAHSIIPIIYQEKIKYLVLIVDGGKKKNLQ